jgi:NitT/TauT family transport system permease protein
MFEAANELWHILWFPFALVWKEICLIFSLSPKFSKKRVFFLSSFLFLVVIVSYLYISHERHIENPRDKVVPSVTQIVDAFKSSVTELDRSKKHCILVTDMIASSTRFAIGFLLLLPGVWLGLHMGLFPWFEASFLRFVTFFDKVPALTLLPILFIAFGLDETAKIALIVIGVSPTIVLDTYLKAKAIPREMIVKGLTLGASQFEIAYKIALPMVLPSILDNLRLSLKPVMLFLLVGESLAATSGMGYRIFVVRRYMAMDTIIAYIAIMSAILFLIDVAMKQFIVWKYPWQNKG